MYKDYYQLQTDPFSTHPNTDTFFISETHKEAWYYLLFGIETQEPFLLLTGEFGMGKTLMCLRLIKVLKEKGVPHVLYIPTANEGYGGILRRIASSLGISTTPEDEEILQDMIYDCFRADTEKSRFYLIIDDAHELDKKILTKLKYLSTFNHDEFFPIIMIFVGHPSFLQDLRTAALSSLNQRIKRRYHLARFGFEDTKKYIYFRLMKSGATGIPFPDETIHKIFEYGGGVPRLINNICDTCLLIGASRHLNSIPPSIVDDARILVEGTWSEAQTEDRADSDSTYDTPPPITGILAEGVLPETQTEAGTDSYSTYDVPPPITFSENLPTGNVAEQAPVFSAQADTAEYEQEIIPSKTSSLVNQKLKKTLIIAVAAILLLSIGMLFQYFMDVNRIFTLFSPATETAPPNPPVQPAAEGLPTLRDELTDKPYSETPVPEARTEGTFSEPTGTPPKQTSGSEQAVLHPFSLKSSSYQQPSLALQEISEIKKLGLTPYLVKADLGDMGTVWRIYIGFYSNAEEANKTKTTYKLTNTTVQKTEYACQVGEFSSETDSLNMFAKLKQSGYFPYAIQKGRDFFRLYIGAFERNTEAEALRQELQRKGIKSQVVKR